MELKKILGEIKITTIYIKDTGYINPGEETSQYSGSNIVNAGTELPLKGVEINYSRGASLDNKPTPGNFTGEPEINYVSRTSPVVVLSGNITNNGDLSDTSNTIYKITSGSTDSVIDQDGSSSSNEIDILYLLDKLCVTRGYKELYYKDSTSNGSILYGLGKTDVFNPTYRHLHVRCKSIRVSQKPSSKLITWTMTCEITKGE